MNDEVWLNTWNLPLKECPSRKLSVKYKGPYQVLKVVSSYVYCLVISDNFKIHNVFHTNLLRPVADDSLPNQILPVLFSHVSTADLKEYEIETIWDSKITWNSVCLLVKWVSYENPTWEPLKVMDTAANAIDAFYSHYLNKPSWASWEAHHDHNPDTD